MRILFLSPRQCFPARSGAKLREYHFLKALAQREDVTYLHFADPGSPPLNPRDLPFCRDVIGVPKPHAYGAWKLLKGVAGRWPLPVLNYTSPEMTATVERSAAAARYDLLHLDSLHMIRYGDPFAASRIVYNWHNIESEAMDRFACTVPSLPKRYYAKLTAAKLRTLERNILEQASGHVVCSERESIQLKTIVPDAKIAVIPNGVDPRYFANAGGAAGLDLIFVGSMDYYPNAEAAISFSIDVWPTVRQSLPAARLLIVGANPTPQVLALGELPGVIVTGTVPDVRPYYSSALAAIVPLRTGGGTRLKILEAMAAGVPVISTPLGAEGLDVAPGRDILIAPADDPKSWVRHLLSLIQSKIRQDLTNSALHLVRTHYDWETLGEKLCAVYRRWESCA